MHKKRQSQSADRATNPSGIKQNENNNNQILLIDPTLEMEYIEDVLKLMARINRTQYSDAQQLRHILKTQNAVYINLLTSIVYIIDPLFGVTNFSDEKFQIFLKRLGYPTKNISKTRFMSLGNSHTYLSSLHILSWLSKQAEKMLNINEILEKGEYNAMQIENQSFSNKLISLRTQYLLIAYTSQSEGLEQQMEKQLREAKGTLTYEYEKQIKDIKRLDADINLLKLQEPNLQELEKSINQEAQKCAGLASEISEITSELEVTRQYIGKEQRMELELDDGVMQLNKQAQTKKNLIESQPLKLEKAKELELLDASKVIQSKKLAQDYKDQIAIVDQLRQQKSQLLLKIYEVIQQINANKTRIQRDFDILETIPISAQLQESEKGVEIFLQNDMLLDIPYMDIEFEQKIMNDSQQNGKRRKSIFAYDLLVKRDSNSILQMMLPNKIQILQEIEQSYLNSEETLKQSVVEMSAQLQIQKELEKQFEELQCEKGLIEQEISQLSDSTEELKVIKQIYQEHQQKQQQILKDLEHQKIERKAILEWHNLEQLDIQRIKQKLLDNQEINQNLQIQAEQSEESNINQQQNYEQWVAEQLENMLNRCKISNN